MINDESSTVEAYAWLVTNHVNTLAEKALVEGDWKRYATIKEISYLIDKYYPTEANNFCMDIIGNEIQTRD